MKRGTLLADRYEVRDRLGRGGMGEVWSARDLDLRREVAIKLLLPDEGLPEDLSARFERESIAAAQINHPNVVAVHDRGVHDDTLFLVMERVDGIPLSTLISTSGTLSFPRALELGSQICAALEATHDAGVVHYDIKPQNVMITTAGTAKVVDFGIAGLLRAQQLSVVHSSRLAPAATLEYAAPEQFTAERGDARSDLFALGGVLFAMLAGHAPFTGHNAWAVMAAKMSVDAPRLDEVTSNVPPALADLVARLLEREPARRPQTAHEVLERLDHLRTGTGSGLVEPLTGTTLIEDVTAAQPASPDAVHPAPVRERAAVGRGPRQLPADTGLFTGREGELEALFALVAQARTSGEPGMAVISAIDGMGGVGKTALAVRAAHRLAPRFPDGQLFLDLHGFTEGTTPRDPGDALAALLGSLGVAPQQIPADTDSRAAFYRDRLADTRTLILLDNAANEAQVRPLLPATDGCVVLVTSRQRLKALDDALPLALDVLPQREAVALLRRAARRTVEPDEEPLLERAAELCGRLPLALLIAGAVLRSGGAAWDLATLIDRLAARRPGDELAGYTDETRSMQAVFDLSYRQLPEDLQAAFRRVGLLPGPELDAYASAALLDIEPDPAGRLLQRLADHSLLAAAAPGRYRPPDLVRAYARTLAVELDPAADRDAALDRLLHYYAHTAHTASAPIARFPRLAPKSPTPAHVPTPPDPDAARTWLRTEHPNLAAAQAHAHTHHLHEHTINLAAGMSEILLTDGPWTRALDIHQAAADAATHLDKPSAHATALNDLGRVRYMTGDYPAAADAQTRALEIYRGSGHRLGQATALNSLGQVRYLTGDFPAAADAQAQALEIYREIGHRLGEATALTDLGQVRYMTGDFLAAADAQTQALEIFREIGNRGGEANTLIQAGQLRYMTGDFPAAADAQTRALEIYREIGHRLGEATALNNLGQVRTQTGDFPAAADAQTRALEIYREIGHRLGEATALTSLAQVRTQTGNFPAAADAQTRALEIYREVGNRGGEANALTSLGQVRYMTGDFSAAADAQARALEIFRQTGNRGNEAYALNHYAAAIAASGDRPRALALYHQALAMNRELNKPDDEATSLEGIANHHLATGTRGQGVTYLRLALGLYQRLGMRAETERAQARLTEIGATQSDLPSQAVE